ncbi:MAG TPA: TRAP transporter permease [Firmicutes bacterium]|nr:TRAP transporter permease [Bacillota bacterium]
MRKWLTQGNLVAITIKCIAIAMSLFHLYTAAFGTRPALIQRSIHLGFVLVLGFLLYPASKVRKGKGPNVVDALFAALSLCTVAYIWLNYEHVITRIVWVSPLKAQEYVLGILFLILIVELTRRTSGPALPIIAVASVLYGLLGNHLPGILRHSGFSLVEIIDQLYLTTEGVFGVPIQVSASVIVLFIIFGAFLEKSKIGDYFMRFASALTGRSAGGPAKMAVVSSGLVGTISGSAVANVVITGQISIPLMKKSGYRDYFAGAVEAVASTGGQIMPPVMGAAAFVMSEYTGIPYLTICKYAILPAILYYAACYLMVHFEALKLGLKGLPDNEVPKISSVLREAYLFIPIGVIVFLMILGFTPMYACLYSILSVVLITAFNRHTRLDLRAILSALEKGAVDTISVAITCACAGIVIGIVMLTGLGLRLSSLILGIAGSNVILALILTATVALVLGMGLPTTPAYVICAALLVPALIKMGINVVAAHLFALYFAVISCITPPVALASYAGASLANANASKTGFTAVKLGIAAYIVPFMFVFSPPLLLMGPAYKVIQASITALIGVTCLAAAGEGWMITKVTPLGRLLLFAASLTLIDPGSLTDVLGFILLGISLALQLYRRREDAKRTFAGEASQS